MRNPFKQLIIENDPSILKEINEYFILSLERKIMENIRQNPKANIWNTEISFGDPCLHEWKGLYPIQNEDKSFFARQLKKYCKENTLLCINTTIKNELNPGKLSSCETYKISASLTRLTALEN